MSTLPSNPGLAVIMIAGIGGDKEGQIPVGLLDPTERAAQGSGYLRCDPFKPEAISSPRWREQGPRG